MKKLNEKTVNGTVVCPKCGTEFTVGEKPTSKLPEKAADRIEALRAAGIDVTGFFAMQGANGGEYVGVNRDGNLKILADDDILYKEIFNQGTVPNTKLFRRWVMSQMFHMLAAEEPVKSSYTGRHYSRTLTESIRAKGYDYMWKQLADEFRAQQKMIAHKDITNYDDRRRWFNPRLVVYMLRDYLYQLKKYVKHCKVKHCKGAPYKHICGKDVFVEDIEKKVYKPIKEMIMKAESGYHLSAVLRFVGMRKHSKSMSFHPTMPTTWIDAYKGAGAFFTLQNLIRFHGCTIVDDSGRRLNKEESYLFLECKAKEYAADGGGWRLVGLLRKVLKDNNIDIKKKMAEWRK